MATSAIIGDKYRSYLSEEEIKSTNWRAGPPNYDAVNKLFEQERTKVWSPGSLEERVQNLVKTWEMELVHKNPSEYKSINAEKFILGVNGKRYYTLEEVVKIGGGYNAFLQTSLPPELRLYNPDDETFDSSHEAFTTTFPRGFALEILQVYTGPPVITYKFRHWGHMEGPFKGISPTGELVELVGTATFELDENSKITKVEFFFDRGELLAGLYKNRASGESGKNVSSGCPIVS